MAASHPRHELINAALLADVTQSIPAHEGRTRLAREVAAMPRGFISKQRETGSAFRQDVPALFPVEMQIRRIE